MGLLSFCLAGLCRVASERAPDLAAGAGRVPCDAAPRCETPLSFAELVAASAFLDFGGLFEERWLSGRGSETGEREPP